MGRKLFGKAWTRAIAVVSISGLSVLMGCTPSPSPGGGNPDTDAPFVEAGSFSMLAYNVAGLPQGISGSNPSQNMSLISPRLNAYDIVLTQENFDWWVAVAWLLEFSTYNDQLRSEVTHPYQSTMHPGPEAVGINRDSRPLLVGDGLGTLSRFPFDEGPRIPWKNCHGDAFSGAADCLAMKGFSVSRVRVAQGHDIDVYNLHMEAGGGPEDQRLQKQDIEQLGTFIEDYSEGRAVIIGGDTNLHTGSDHEDGFDGADTELWALFLERLDLTDACTAVSCDDISRIDKFAYRSGGRTDLTLTSYGFVPELFQNANGVDLSDHEPLAVTFAWDEL